MSLNQYLTTDFHYSLLWKHPDMDNIHNSWLRFQNGVVQRHQRTPQDPPSETEALFEKPLTPSDVGKLNRLVIPKQHAERCFPLATETPSSPSMAAEKGVLLCFEDVDDGKQWRFRYSYWTSSQSYVLTKGWSRYVKEKQLDAGDVVFFHRHRADGRRLFIGWRRQNGVGPAQAVTRSPSVSYGTNTASSRDYNNHINPLQNYHQSEYLYPGQVGGNQTIDFTGNLRTVRLFGVDLECQPEEDRSEPSTRNHSPQTGDGDRLYLYSNQPYHPS